jgi:Ca-activated chloride channel family protein
MDYRFSKWDERHAKAQSSLEKMLKVFNQLLIYTNGDANQALQWLTEMDRQYGLGDDEVGIGDFIEYLKREGYLEEPLARRHIQHHGQDHKENP